MGRACSETWEERNLVVFKDTPVDNHINGEFWRNLLIDITIDKFIFKCNLMGDIR